MRLTTPPLLFLLLLLANKLNAFVMPQPSNGGRSVTRLDMVVGPKQALALEKLKNPKQVERTVTSLMKTKKLTRAQAEKRYGEFLVDPDGFALRANEESYKAEGYKNWEEAAIGRSKDPEATRERINKFKRESTTKALGVILLFCGTLLYLSDSHKVPTVYGNLIDTPTTNPYREYLMKQREEMRQTERVAER